MDTVLSWTHNGTVVNEDENISFSPKFLKHNLIIDNADVNESGLYTCHAMLGDEVAEQNISIVVLAGMYIIS